MSWLVGGRRAGVRALVVALAALVWAAPAQAQGPIGAAVAPPVAPSPQPPHSVVPLPVPGFAPASHVGPSAPGPGPWPVVVVLHGNFDRPEWECATWQRAAAHYGWILCPRGKRTPWASKAEDRWTYASRPAVRREVAAALKALGERYPGKVSLEGTVLAGFSLGAIYAPALAAERPKAYPWLFLVEGGLNKLTPALVRKLARGGVKGVGLAMSAAGRRRRARKVAARLRSIGLKAETVEMPGAGHNYSRDFGPRARRALESKMGEGRPPAGGVPGPAGVEPATGGAAPAQ